MEVQRTAVDNTPLAVNLLRLIRNARSPNYKDHEKGPVTFHFGGLCMRDTGGYAEAEELWRWASAEQHHHSSSKDSGSDHLFRGPVFLAVYLNDSPAEVWTLQDFRDPATKHSVPRDFEQLEQLNTLVRVLYAHLRSQEIYGAILQSCVTTADDASVTQTEVFGSNGGTTSAAATAAAVSASSRLSPMMREATSSSIHAPHSPRNRVSLRLFLDAEEGPQIPVSAQKQFLWSSEDFVRVDVVMNKAWRYQAAPPASAFLPVTATAPAAAVEVAPDRSLPIKTSSPTSCTHTGDSEPLSQSTSPEVTGSLAKSSLPTPHLAPTCTPPSSVNRPVGVSPTRGVSPLLATQGKSPIPVLSDFSLPPPEMSELFDNDHTRQSWSSPLGPHNPSLFSSVPGAPVAKSNVLGSPAPTTVSPSEGVPAKTTAVGHLEDVMWLCDSPHLRRMGTLISAGKDSTAAVTATSSSPPGAGRPFCSGYGGGLTIPPLAQPQIGSLLAAASVGALSGLELDNQLGWSGAELDGFTAEDTAMSVGSGCGGGGRGRHSDAALAVNFPSDTTTEQLMSLLGLCAGVKLHHVPPAPFGDLVIALNLKDSPT
jgi:hypothetical protein